MSRLHVGQCSFHWIISVVRPPPGWAYVVWTSASTPGIMERGIARLEGEVIDEYHRSLSSFGMYGSHPPFSFTSEMALARNESFACRLTSSGVS